MFFVPQMSRNSPERLAYLLGLKECEIHYLPQSAQIPPKKMAIDIHSAILCNAGHYNMEICVGELEQTSTQIETCPMVYGGFPLEKKTFIFSGKEIPSICRQQQETHWRLWRWGMHYSCSALKRY